MTLADPNDFSGIADWEDRAATTGSFLPLMQLLESFAQYCFRRDLTFFADSGTLLGAVRHRAIIPWDYDVDLGMGRAAYRRLIDEFDDPPTLRLDLSAYDERDAALCVVPPGAQGDYPYLDVSCYQPDGRSLMSEALQRRWPLDSWRTDHAEHSWSYDFAPGELDPLAALPAWCGLLRAPAGWQRRLDRHYDSWHARPESLARAMCDLPFDPMVPAVRLAPSYHALDAALADTGGRRPFVVRACPGFSLDSNRLEEALRQERSALRGYVFDGPGADQQRTPMIDPREALARWRAGTLDVNVTESRVTVLPLTTLPETLRAALDPGDDYAFSYLMTARGVDTPFHWDREAGSGYLYLAEGEKYWMFMPGGETDAAALWGRSMTDILSADGFRFWGRVEVVHQRAGDLVVFPVAWCHRVLTYQASLGVGGYLRTDLSSAVSRTHQ